jgi:hypothetical protein
MDLNTLLQVLRFQKLKCATVAVVREGCGREDILHGELIRLIPEFIRGDIAKPLQFT